jgi:murein DD-endopeptidase MepM/ murein hydrolase activator NlpD
MRGAGEAFASVFFAHLSESVVTSSDVQVVERGEAVGRVGKTGNASGASVMPHVHLELAVLPDQESALSERHFGADHSSSAAAERFFAMLEARCLEPNGFWPRLENVRRARRADPFLVLTCLSGAKPGYGPDSRLGSYSVPWSTLYRARTFDVGAGPG